MGQAVAHLAELSQLRKCGKTRDKGGVKYEANTGFMARNVSENYQYQNTSVTRALGDTVAFDTSDKCFATESRWVI